MIKIRIILKKQKTSINSYEFKEVFILKLILI